MKTYFPKKEFHNPKYYILDANNKTLGRLASQASLLLIGKYTSFYTPSIDQGNFVIIINSENIKISGKKLYQKKYYKNSQRPGSLKIKTFLELNKKFPTLTIKKAISGMLPKNLLKKKYINRLFIYSDINLIGQNLATISFLKAKWYN